MILPNMPASQPAINIGIGIGIDQTSYTRCVSTYLLICRPKTGKYSQSAIF